MATRSRTWPRPPYECAPATSTKTPCVRYADKFHQAGIGSPSFGQRSKPENRVGAVFALAASAMSIVRIHAEALLWCILVDSGIRALSEKIMPGVACEVRSTHVASLHGKNIRVCGISMAPTPLSWTPKLISEQ